MPAPRENAFSAHTGTRGTRAPEGSSPARPHGTGIYRDVPVWPGITWGDDSRCTCSWGYLRGVRQVKVASGACPVHVPGREPGRETAGPLPPAPSDEELLAACRAGTVTWELYLSAARAWRAAHEASLLAAVLVPRITELAGLLAPGDRPASYCRCGRPHDVTDRDGHRRCRACRRLRDRESAARSRARKRAGQLREAA
jgi:hypothetical protein